VAACAALVLAVGTLSAAPKRVTLTVDEAERWAESPGSAVRDRVLSEWARDASLDELLWLLRHPSSTLAGAEPALVDAAILRTPPERAELLQRLLARRAIVVPRPARGKKEPPLPSLEALRPWASVYRVTAILPDRGEYAAFARAVRLALAEGLRAGRPAGARPITLDTLATGDADPARVAAAFAAASPRSDVIVGELLSTPTLALATAVAATGQTLISPTATDERIGRVGARVVQVGPGAAARARALADVVLGGRPLVVAISGSSTGVRSAFADAFAAEVAARGGRVVKREPARVTPSELALQVRALQESKAEVLFWDGSPRDAEAMLRALASAGAALRLCGGSAVSPEGMRPTARPLLEGVVWVNEDWRLPAPVRARLDSLATATGLRGGAFWTQGWLAGRSIAAAIDGGARTADEVARALRPRDREAAAAGGLDATRFGATLPVYVMTGGRAVEARDAQ
jgi:ABC-type branched-subunit amino acid transport system substrate-binding protein